MEDKLKLPAQADVATVIRATESVSVVMSLAILPNYEFPCVAAHCSAVVHGTRRILMKCSVIGAIVDVPACTLSSSTYLAFLEKINALDSVSIMLRNWDLCYVGEMFALFRRC